MATSYKKIYVSFEFDGRRGVFSPSVVGFVDVNANRQREPVETLRLRRTELAWGGTLESTTNLFKKKCVLAAAAPVGTKFSAKVMLDNANGRVVASLRGTVRRVPGASSGDDNVVRIVMLTLGEPS